MAELAALFGTWILRQRAWRRGVPYVFVGALVAIGWWNPAVGLMVQSAALVLAARGWWHWLRTRYSLARTIGPIPRGTIRKLVSGGVLVSGVLLVVAANTVVLLIASIGDKNFATQYASMISPRIALWVSIVAMLYGAMRFGSLRGVARRAGLPPYRMLDETRTDLVAKFQQLFSLPEDWNRPGATICLAAFAPVLFAVAGFGAVAAAPETPTAFVARPPHTKSSGSSSPGDRAAHAGSTTTSSPTTAGPVAITPQTTAPPVTTCVGVGGALKSRLPANTGSRAAEVFANHYTDLQCLLGTPDSFALTKAGELTVVDFVTHGGERSGVIVVNTAGDAAALTVGDPLMPIIDDGALVEVTEPMLVQGTLLRLAYLSKGTCYAEVRADSYSSWTVVAPDQAEALIAVFVIYGQIGRPVAGGSWLFSYPHPRVTLRGTPLRLSGVSSAVVQAAAQTTRCPDLSTLGDAIGHGAPGKPAQGE